jgi:16S rRNA (guanine966-N2)-methyltransferase
MRIIAGTWRSRRLVRPAGGQTRPSSDRLREALFAALGDISGARVLDAFAGSGALGLEALSRGAADCVFCETHPRALAALRANIAALEAEPRAVLRPLDCRRQLRVDARSGRTYDLVLLDPPYPKLAGLLTALEPLLAVVVSRHGRLVVESPAGGDPDLSSFALESRRSVGAATVTIHTRREEA